jgi:hypothetical protein
MHSISRTILVAVLFTCWTGIALGQEDEEETILNFRKCMLQKLAGVMVYSKQVVVATTKFGSVGKDDAAKLEQKVESASSALTRKATSIEDKVGGCPLASGMSASTLKAMADEGILNLVGSFSPGDAATLGTILGNSCTPDCAGRVCGDNGCGGSCGTCDSGFNCHEPSGTCVSS